MVSRYLVSLRPAWAGLGLGLGTGRWLALGTKKAKRKKQKGMYKIEIFKNGGIANVEGEGQKIAAGGVRCLSREGRM